MTDRTTLFFCVLALAVAAACAVVHFSPVWILVPVLAAIVSAMRTPFRTIVEMFFGGRR